MKLPIRHCSHFLTLLKVSLFAGVTMVMFSGYLHAAEIVTLPENNQPSMLENIAEHVYVRLPVRHLVDVLIQAQVSPAFLTFLLIVPVIILFLVFLRQVIGIHTGSIHYIILIAGMWSLLGRTSTLVMFASARIGHHSIWLLTKKLYLLYASKTWASIAVSCLICLLLYVGIHSFLPANTALATTQPALVFFPLVTFSLMMPYVFPERESIATLQRRWLFLQFVFSVCLCVVLLQRTWLQELVFAFPDYLIAVIGATLLLGRYAGLQAAEYVRFWPLIQHYFKEEE